MAIIYSYPTSVPQLGDKVIGSNILDSAGNPVVGNPTVQFNFSDIKTLVDQQYVSQLESSSSEASQSPAGLGVVYSIRFGTPETVDISKNVQLLQGTGTATTGDKIQFNKAGTYQITLTYSIGVTGTSSNVPYLIFRTLQAGTTQIGPSVVYNDKFNTVNEPISLIIPITIQVTAGSYFNFQFLRSSTINDGGLVKNAAPINVASVTEPSIATIQISKLI
tara:strand:- start:7 stop:666 length:660 start_codon:yes stop_codon:yes gene_type:complete